LARKQSRYANVFHSNRNTHLEYHIIQALLAKNAKVYIATRNKDKSLSAIDELKKQTGKQAFFLALDLADLKSVKACAEEFLKYAVVIFHASFSQ
jgi:NAD(P)-dependent dehydrogenase (short-subunit alcohol dehydrogenase family)